MIFLNPAGLWLLLGVPVLIIIYLIKTHHESRPVSSTYIWKLSSRFMKKRFPIQRINRLFMFIMQLLMIITASLLAARPAIVNGESCDYIAIIDASASMQIKDNTGTRRFDYAIEQVEEMAHEINNGHSLSVILAYDDASYIVRDSASVSEVKLALKNAVCSYGSCNTDAALSLAKLICDRSDNAKIFFFTDCEYADSKNISVVNLNKDEWNVSVDSLTAETDGKNTVFTGSLTSYNQDAAVTAGLKIDGSIIDAQIINCVNGVETEIVFTAEGVSTYNTAEIYVEASDALDADNSYAICKKRNKTYNVMLVSESPLYLESALSALGNCKVTTVSSLEDTELSGQDLYIFDGIAPQEYPTDGGILLFGTDNLPDGLTVSGISGEAAALSINSHLQSDLYNNLPLKETVVTNFASLRGNSAWEPVLLCEDATVAATSKMNTGMQFTVISFDLHDSNLPLQTDFLVLMRNLVEYSAPTVLKYTDYAVGGTVEFTVLPSATQLYVELPDSSVKTLSITGCYSTAVPEIAGIYTAVMTTDDDDEYVDFFVHIPEGETSPVAKTALKIELSDTGNLQSEAAISEIWFWLAAFLLLILLIEWGWYYHEQY